MDVLNNNLWKVIVVLLTLVVCSLSKTAPLSLSSVPCYQNTFFSFWHAVKGRGFWWQCRLTRFPLGWNVTRHQVTRPDWWSGMCCFGVRWTVTALAPSGFITIVLICSGIFYQIHSHNPGELPSSTRLEMSCSTIWGKKKKRLETALPLASVMQSRQVSVSKEECRDFVREQEMTTEGSTCRRKSLRGLLSSALFYSLRNSMAKRLWLLWLWSASFPALFTRLLCLHMVKSLFVLTMPDTFIQCNKP